MKTRGLRKCFAYGGTVDYTKLFAPTATERLDGFESLEDQNNAGKLARLKSQADNVSGLYGVSQRRKAAALSTLEGEAGAIGGSLGTDAASMRGLSGNQRLAAAMRAGDAQNAADDFNTNRSLRRMSAGFDDQSNPFAFADGGTVQETPEQLMARISATYGVGTGSPAPQPAPQAAQPAPQPAGLAAQPAPQPAGLAARLRNIATGNVEGRMKAAGFADGGVPYVDGDGYVHGPKGVDKVPAKVAETGENILVSHGERIVNAHQNKALEGLARRATGMPLDAYLETATGQPVGPKVKQGLRAAADGGMMGEIDFSRVRPQGGSFIGRAVNGARALGDKVMDAGRGMLSAGDTAKVIPEVTQPANGGRYVGNALGASTKYTGAGIGGVGEAAKDLGRMGKGALRKLLPAAAVLSAGHQGVDTGGDLYNVWTNDKTDLPTKIAGTAEGLGNVAGNILSLGLVHNPVTSAVGALTDNDTALTRALKGSGRALDEDVLHAAPAKPAAAPAPKPAAVTPAVPAPQAPVETPTRNDVPRGLRGVVSTPTGSLSLSRGKNGQLNVTNDFMAAPSAVAGADEAARVAEAARMQADMKRQVDTFDRIKLDNDMKSNNPADRKSAAMRMGLRQLQVQQDIENRRNDLAARGQDLDYEGKMLDAGVRRATLQNQMFKDNEERMRKSLDDLLGPETIEVDGKKQTNAERQKFLTRLSKTLGENKRSMAQLDPKYLTDFHTAHLSDEDGKNGAFMKAFNSWIAGTPDVEDHNPFRSIRRLDGPEGQTGALGFYRNGHGAWRHEGSTVGKTLLPGGYDYNRKELLDR